MRKCVLCILLAGFSAATLAQNLDPLAANQQLFQLSQVGFKQLYMRKYAFKWTSASRQSARLYRQGSSVFGLPVTEAVVEFADQRISELRLNIYTRGDVGAVSRKDFQFLIGRCEKLIAGGLEQRSKKSLSQVNGATTMAFLWRDQNLVYRFEASFTENRKGFSPEYMQLRIMSYEAGKSLSAHGRSKLLMNSREIREKVKRENGDVWIDGIPMVDQGSKGYCACAAASRVLKHYGRRIDEHKLAQISQTTQVGTEPEDLLRALKKLERSENFKLRILHGWPQRRFKRLVKDYTRESQRLSVPVSPHLSQQATTSTLLYTLMKPDILLATVKRKKSLVQRFRRDIQANIDNGTPLLWTMVLGVFREEGGKQLTGGHMRLIIGYSKEKDEIIYSDSWGKGHESKRMPLTQALAITTGLYSINAF